MNCIVKETSLPGKIGLISDIHATLSPLKEALAVFRQEGVECILCPGDIAGYGNELDECVDLLIKSKCRAISGNHEIWHLEKSVDRDDRTTSYFRRLPDVLDFTLEGKRVYMVHASPPQSFTDGIRLLDEQGKIIPQQKAYWTERLADFDYDILIVGHTHQIFCEKLGDMLVINPGSTKFNHSCAILTLPAMEFRLIALSNKTPLKAWNWGTGLRSE